MPDTDVEAEAKVADNKKDNIFKNLIFELYNSTNSNVIYISFYLQSTYDLRTLFLKSMSKSTMYL